MTFTAPEVEAPYKGTFYNAQVIDDIPQTGTSFRWRCCSESERLRWQEQSESTGSGRRCSKEGRTAASEAVVLPMGLGVKRGTVVWYNLTKGLLQKNIRINSQHLSWSGERPYLRCNKSKGKHIIRPKNAAIP